MTKLSVNEYARMWKVLDQSLSAHSMLRDRYRRRERGSTLLVIVLSIFATAFAFLSGGGLVSVGPVTARLATWLGVITSLIFFLSLADLVLDWRRRAWAHEDAAQRLSELKMNMRAATVSGDTVETGEVDLRSLYGNIMASVTAIPEQQFLPMKAKHHRKFAVSELIDTHKGAPVPYLRLLAILHGLHGTKAGANNVTMGSGSVEEPPL
jgi:hypothetical protein